ncbi:hypothetical protein NKF26_00685 [Haladaptatus sp. AB618]|uniref:hypothetical protein n=1 Tax=Haladaptatus sp. AB618 TaxID=2934173 RepID=UPI00209C69FD|nr:hypothetical protein [Haladaptatus sp. AB618]MCO8252313.1 hypothetical protein [Haladaptatus sp. AB618]
MSEKELGRRRFLRSTAAAGIGITGGIAASGTAAADNSREIQVFSNSNYWEYQIFTKIGFDDVEKGSYADGDDYISNAGNNAGGQVSKGGQDTFWMDSDDWITGISVTYNDYGYIDIDVASPTDYYQAIGVQRDQNPDWPGYNYTIDIDGDVEPNDSHNYFDYGQDSIDGGTFRGTVDPGDTDSVLRTGPPTHVFIEDPNSPGLGLEIFL